MVAPDRLSQGTSFLLCSLALLEDTHMVKGNTSVCEFFFRENDFAQEKSFR